MREIYHEQLRILGEELMQMGALCEEGISAAMKALFNSNEEMAQRAMEIEREIDRKERDIEAQSMKLLLCQQPVAGELRTVSSALRLISDMERIGDQASDIAEITVHVTQRDPEVMELMETIIRKCKAHHKPFGLSIGTDLELVKFWLNNGASFISMGTPQDYFREMSKTVVKQVRELEGAL